MENFSRKTENLSDHSDEARPRRSVPKLAGMAWSNFRMYGFWDTARYVLIHFLSWTEKDTFDRRHGTDTSHVLAARFDEQPAPGQRVQSLTIHPRILKYIFGHLPIDHPEFQFIDFGCGKGRALLCASEFPFRKITGVEWSQDLCDVARQNLKAYRSRTQQCTDLEVICGDVRNVPFPDSNIVLYMYNPFGPKIATEVYKNIQQHMKTSAHRFLVVFSGLGRLQDEFVRDCFDRYGIEVLETNQALSTMGSWILGEAKRS